MRKPGRFLVTLLALPFLVGCFSVATVPVPRAAPDREALALKGVVITDGTTEEVIEFSELHEATWTPSSLSIVADVNENGTTQTLTRLIPITQLSALLVRQLDPGLTSAIVGGVIVGAIAGIALYVTGRGDPSQQGG